MNKIILKCADNKPLEFEWVDKKGNWGETFQHFIDKKTKYVLRISPDFSIQIFKAEFKEVVHNLPIWEYVEGVTESLNPQSLHIIEERECPECKNYIYKEDYDCQNCTDGKIEKIVGKYEWINDTVS